MALPKSKLMDDNLDSSSSENEEIEETKVNNCNKNTMPLIEPRKKLVDDDLDSTSESESESVIGNDAVPGPSKPVHVSELKACIVSEIDTNVQQDNDNDGNDSSSGSSESINFKTAQGELSAVPSTDSDEDYGGPSCSIDENNLDEIEDKKYRPKQSKQSKTKKKTKKKMQKSGTSNKNNDNPNQPCEQEEELEIKSNVPLSSTATNSGHKNSQSRRFANQKPRQYRRDRNDRSVATQKPPKIPNIPHPHGHVEVKRVTANDAIDILERMKARLALDSDNESDSKNKGSGARGARGGKSGKNGKGGRDICSVLVIRKKAEYMSD